jgi:hypothetical protein
MYKHPILKDIQYALFPELQKGILNLLIGLEGRFLNLLKRDYPTGHFYIPKH